MKFSLIFSLVLAVALSILTIVIWALNDFYFTTGIFVPVPIILVIFNTITIVEAKKINFELGWDDTYAYNLLRAAAFLNLFMFLIPGILIFVALRNQENRLRDDYVEWEYQEAEDDQALLDYRAEMADKRKRREERREERREQRDSKSRPRKR